MGILMNPHTAMRLQAVKYEGGRVYLLTGRKGMGRASYAREKAMEWLGQNNLSVCPDYYEMGNGGKLGVADFDGLRKFVSTYPVRSEYKVALIDAMSITEEAQNSLLKLFEEGAERCVFFLVLNQPVISTILSRVRMISFYPLTDEQMSSLKWGKDGDVMFARNLANGCPGSFFELEAMQDYISTCKNILCACEKFDKVGLLREANLLREKDKNSFFEKYPRAYVELFVRYWAVFVEKEMALSTSSGQMDIVQKWNQISNELVKTAHEMEKDRAFSKNDFFELMRKVVSHF